ncbi:sortase [Patescibacteria group bacterium]|nr:sortase [Patescibacteria group bacterium]
MDTYVKGPARVIKPPRRHPKTAGIFSLLLLVLGIFLIFQAAWPVVGWYFFVMPSVSTKIVSPLASTFGPLVRAQEDQSYDPSTWFANSGQVLAAQSAVAKAYTLTIPKLKINGANVVVGGDLKKSLVAWPTSPGPGQWGNNIIFGHSELPQFASPTNYSGIFTFLMDLNEGDDIYINSDGVRYHYQVFDKKVVDPDDISVLEQKFDTSYVTLITCVPPGTIWKRGIIRAKLIQI